MKLDINGYKIISDFEGLSLTPYFATTEEKEKGIATIGYGNTFYPSGTKVTIHDAPITKANAFLMLQHVADNFADKVATHIKSNVNQNQFNALCSFAYNVGIANFASSTLLKLVNINPNDANISKEFLKWNKQAGKVLDGLTKRRIQESALYFTT